MGMNHLWIKYSVSIDIGARGTVLNLKIMAKDKSEQLHSLNDDMISCNKVLHIQSGSNLKLEMYKFQF